MILNYKLFKKIKVFCLLDPSDLSCDSCQIQVSLVIKHVAHVYVFNELRP